MMALLILYISGDGPNLRARVGERSEASLPAKSAPHPAFVVNQIRRSDLYFLHEIRERTVRPESDQDVDMIGHSVYGDELLSLGFHYTSYLFVDFFSVRFGNQRLSSLNCKYDVNVDLGVGVRHSVGPPQGRDNY